MHVADQRAVPRVSSTTKSHDGVAVRLRRALMSVIRKRIPVVSGGGWGVARRGGKWAVDSSERGVCALGALLVVEQLPAPPNGKSAVDVVEHAYALPSGWVRSFAAGFAGWRYLPWCPEIGRAAYDLGRELADEFCG